jgi:RNA recognition motif-containing protein
MNSAQNVPTNRLYVGNISWTVDNSVLFSAFAHLGAIDARVISDRETGRSKGFGFVSFPDELTAAKAMDALQDFELNGRPLRISFAQARLTRPGNVPQMNEGSQFGFDPHTNMRMTPGPVEMKRSSPMLVPGYAGAIPSISYLPGTGGLGSPIRSQPPQPAYSNQVYGNPYVSNPSKIKWDQSNAYVASQNGPVFNNPTPVPNMYYPNPNLRKAGPFQSPQLPVQTHFNSNFRVPHNRSKMADSLDHFPGNANYMMNPDQMNGVISNTLTAHLNGNINNNTNNNSYLFDSSNSNTVFPSNLSNRDPSEPASNPHFN